jgi:hypothetical protein
MPRISMLKLLRPIALVDVVPEVPFPASVKVTLPEFAVVASVVGA